MNRHTFIATFPAHKARRLDTTMRWVNANPPKQPVPMVSGKPAAQILAQEEANNRTSPSWTHSHSKA